MSSDPVNLRRARKAKARAAARAEADTNAALHGRTKGERTAEAADAARRAAHLDHHRLKDDGE